MVKIVSLEPYPFSLIRQEGGREIKRFASPLLYFSPAAGRLGGFDTIWERSDHQNPAVARTEWRLPLEQPEQAEISNG